MIQYILAAVTVISGGSYLYFRGEKLLDAVLIFKARLQSGYFRKIRKNAQCPACGAKHGEIVYNPEIQRVVHGCSECNAAWADLPRINPEKWDFLGRDLKFAGDRAEEVRNAFAIANAPIKLKEPPKKEAVN